MKIERHRDTKSENRKTQRQRKIKEQDKETKTNEKEPIYLRSAKPIRLLSSID